MNLTTLAKDACKTATEKGWWDPAKTDLECICLMHSELSEAVEELRNSGVEPFYIDPKTGKPEGWITELADCLIRILDFTEHKGQTGLLREAIIAKMEYNKTRTHRHGGKTA